MPIYIYACTHTHTHTHTQNCFKYPYIMDHCNNRLVLVYNSYTRVLVFSLGYHHFQITVK